MTPREGFKYGFLLRCAEEGLTIKEAESRAARGLEKQAGGIADALKGAPEFAARWGGRGLALGLLGSAGAGAGVGYGLAKLNEGDVDPEEIQRQELISAYQAQTELARRKSIMDAAERLRSRPRSFHGI